MIFEHFIPIFLNFFNLLKKCIPEKFSLFHFVTFLWFWTMLCVLHLFCGNFTLISSINLLHPMQQEAFPHQYLRSRICFERTIAHAFIMVLMQMRNPKIDNFDWIKMKGQLRLVLRIEHCSILNTVSSDLKNLIIHCTHDKIVYYNTSLMIQILSLWRSWQAIVRYW